MGEVSAYWSTGNRRPAGTGSGTITSARISEMSRALTTPEPEAATSADAAASASPSFIITMQNGQLVATVPAPVSRA